MVGRDMGIYIFSFWQFLNVCMVCEDLLAHAAPPSSSEGRARHAAGNASEYWRASWLGIT